MERVYGAIAAVLLFAAGISVPVEAAVITVDDFTTITGGEFVDIPQTFATGASTASVAVTGDPANVLGKIGTGPSALASDPGDGNGWSNPQTIPVVLNMNVPVAAFGVSFIHSGLFGGTQPGQLDVYDQPGGAGNLIGTVTSAGLPPGPRTDFVGIWSDTANIRSAVLPYVQHAISVDGYGVSLTPLPEPGTFAVLVVGALVGAVLRRRR